MSESMVESVARAISGAPYPSKISMGRARRAIEAMRAATPEMISAGNEARRIGNKSVGRQTDDTWEAMIDEALK